MSALIPPSAIVPADYPQLSKLVWSRDPARPITSEEAFRLYEANWRHVDDGQLTPAESALIHALAKAHGNGRLLV
ncbi:hypothetical protein NPA31_014215 [Aurantimonas sp. MSK8Z-1]|uniref:hypothetical protein n=1 Tax=Mangrovibrevibacter kandeliae TaxID=2968473 RepID=UPI0021199729|nr:hypothetical protein [Aurantimonas sp. MSK8Z-1]MCW4116117.1 hypothetical protein [Aurantimonas sp. MSK8Z-1]